MRINRHSLKVIRERSGLSISALAEQAGIGQSHLSLIEAGKRGGSAAVIKQLADALHVPLNAIIEIEAAA